MADITLEGNAFNTNGDLPDTGAQAPDFNLVDNALNDRHLADYAGKKKLLNIVPSLDTGVCATSTKRFDALVEAHKDTVVLIISADLPFAAARFCTSEKLARVHSLSMMRSRNFAKDYGVLIENGPLAGITARAVVVLDAQNRVVYRQLVTEITDEPDYDAAMAALTT